MLKTVNERHIVNVTVIVVKYSESIVQSSCDVVVANIMWSL
jgi:hypothetical protein